MVVVVEVEQMAVVLAGWVVVVVVKRMAVVLAVWVVVVVEKMVIRIGTLWSGNYTFIQGKIHPCDSSSTGHNRPRNAKWLMESFIYNFYISLSVPPKISPTISITVQTRNLARIGGRTWKE